MVIFQGNFTSAGKCSKQPTIGNNFNRCVTTCERIETCQLCYLNDICHHCGILTSLEKVQVGIPIGVKIPQNYSYADNICRTDGHVFNGGVAKPEDSIITTTPPPTTSSKKCSGGLSLVRRSDVMWCIAVNLLLNDGFQSYYVFKVMIQKNKEEMNITTAQHVCSVEGLRISGLESLEETTILKEIVQRNYKTIYKYSNSSKGVGIWVDGLRRHECLSANSTDNTDCSGMKAYNFTDPYIINPTGYDWYTGQPNQGNGTGKCIQMTVFNDESDPRNGKFFGVSCVAVSDDIVRRVAVLCGKLAT